MCISKPTIFAYEIILLVNYAWAHSFGKVATNQHAIAERGWNPLNRNLLLNSQLRATMTMDEKTAEQASGTILIPYHALDNFVHIDESLPTYDPTCLPSPALDKSPALNMTTGTAAFCIDSIVHHSDLMESRERIKNKRENGKTVQQLIEEISRVSAGNVFLAGTCRLGQDVMAKVQANYEHAQEKERSSLIAAKASDLATKKRGMDVLALNLLPTKWNVAQLKSVVNMLKVPGDTAIPTKKADLYARYLQWKTRTLAPLVPDAAAATPLVPDAAAATPLLPLPGTVATSPLTPPHAAAPATPLVPDAAAATPLVPSLLSGLDTLVAYAAAATPLSTTGALARSAMGEWSEDEILAART